jgi:hypothetical protein
MTEELSPLLINIHFVLTPQRHGHLDYHMQPSPEAKMIILTFGTAWIQTVHMSSRIVESVWFCRCFMDDIRVVQFWYNYYDRYELKGRLTIDTWRIMNQTQNVCDLFCSVMSDTMWILVQGIIVLTQGVTPIYQKIKSGLWSNLRILVYDLQNALTSLDVYFVNFRFGLKFLYTQRPWTHIKIMWIELSLHICFALLRAFLCKTPHAWYYLQPARDSQRLPREDWGLCLRWRLW